MLHINYFNGCEATRLQRSAVQRESLTRVCAYAHILSDQKRHDCVAHSKTQQKSGKCHPPPNTLFIYPSILIDYPMTLKRANFSSSCLIPTLRNSTVALAFSPSPSMRMTLPMPKRSCSIVAPSLSPESDGLGADDAED